jgi:hypothetical protein
MTMIGNMQNQSYPRRVGDDRIIRRGEQLIVCSKVDMDEWQVQNNRKTAIIIDEEVWCLVGKQHTASREIRYFLDPWPEYLRQIPGRRIRYDDGYLKARAEKERKRKIQAGAGPILFHLSMLIGFLPSCVKHRIETQFGVPARNATFISIIIEWVLFFALGAILLVFAFGSLLAPSLAIYTPLLILMVMPLLLDLIMRYNSYLREDRNPWGFFEWVFRSHPSGFPVEHSGKTEVIAFSSRIRKRLFGK